MNSFYRNVLWTTVAVISVGFLSACATTATSDEAMKTEKQSINMASGEWVLVHPSNPQALDGNKDGVVTLAEKKSVLG